MNKVIFLTLITFFLIANCSQREVIKTHGIAYLEKREKLIIINETNKNDTVKLLGKPSTKGMVDDNLWIYIERTKVRGSMFTFGKSHIKKNNILVIEFNNYGIASRKEFYNKDNMNKISFAKDITVNEIRKENFIESFLASVRQKMQTKKK